MDMTKPYWNPETNETYLKWEGDINGIPFVCRTATGSITLRNDGSVVHKNQFGITTKIETPTRFARLIY